MHTLALVIAVSVSILMAAPVLAAAVERTCFATSKEGEKVDAYRLSSPTGASVTIITYGGTITDLSVPDKTGHAANVVLGFDNIGQYETQSPYFGCVVGRVGNRIARGRFTLEGKEYVLATNNGPNHLHGGKKGYDKRIWAAEEVKAADGAVVRLTLTDPEGTEGYPGTVKATVTYTLSGNTLRIEYEATTDKATPINLTNHAYFNLKDAGKSDILGHILQVNADAYTPVDETLIPTGTIAPVEGTPIEFRKPKAIGKDIAAMGKLAGYDHNLVLRGQEGKLMQAAVVDEPATGRRMEVWTTQPGVQFYTANFLDGTIVGKNGAVYGQHHAFCLETQHYPDSVNHANFPSTILRPGKLYWQVTEFRFSVAK